MTIPSMLIALAVPYALMLVVPGPNALIMLRASLNASLLSALSAACGIACGAASAAAVAASCAAVAPPGRFLQIAGAIVYAVFLIRAAGRMVVGWDDLDSSATQNAVAGLGSQFGLGFANALLNPVTVPFFVGFFVGHPCTRKAAVLACCVVFSMAIAYFALLGITLTGLRRRSPARAPSRPLLLSMAGALVFFAAHAVWEAAAPRGRPLFLKANPAVGDRRDQPG